MVDAQTGDARAAPGLAPMEGGGAYNRSAHMQAAASTVAVPFLERAAGIIDLDADNRPVCIADYGSSQGRNSLVPMRAAIAVLRARVGGARPISVIHVDLPGNDFGALFQTLETDPDSYLRGDPNVFPTAVGRSFYEEVLPPRQVALGWSAQAAQWLSRLPTTISGHFTSLLAEEHVREIFAAQAAADWQRFLSLRARELRPKGRLVVLQPAIGESGRHGAERLLQAADDSLDELRTRGVIRGEEQARMAIADWLRGRDELLAPFAEQGCFAGLTVVACEVLVGPDPTWAAYLENGDSASLGEQRACFIRATLAPALSLALDPNRRPEERQAFAEALEIALAGRAATEPHEIPQTISVLVVARQDC